MNNVRESFAKIILYVLYFFLLLITALCSFVPFHASMPENSLDSAWQFAMNKAVEQGLIFGKDIIFTFGPYSSIYTTQYHGYTNAMLLTGGSFLAVCYASMATYVLRRSIFTALILLLATACVMFIKDILMNTYGLLFAVAVLQISQKSVRPRTKVSTLAEDAFFALIASGLGLIFAIKASFIVYILFVGILSACLLLYKNKKKLAVILVLFPATLAVVAWSSAGQPILGILYYVSSSFQIASGYTDAMSVLGDNKEIIYFIFASLFVLYNLVRSGDMLFVDRMFLGLIFTAFLFIGFKEGFVRHDGHAMAAATCIFVAGTVLTAVYKTRSAALAFCVCFAALLLIDYPYAGPPYNLLVENFKNTYRMALEGLNDRRTGAMVKEFSDSVSRIEAQSPLPILPGTSDIYSFSLSPLLASGNRWNPRPVMQSYSAYTPWLQQQNENHLIGDRAPDNIFFKVETIDNRFPSIEDGPSWWALLSRYTPVRLESGTLILKRTSAASARLLEKTKVLETSTQLGDVVTVPKTSGIMFAAFHMRRSPLSKLVSIAFKPPQMTLTAFVADGSARSYRFIPGMAELGFELSPLVETAGDFALLFRDRGELAGKDLTGLSITQDKGLGGVDSTYDVVFSNVASPPSVTADGMFDPIDNAPPLADALTFVDACAAIVDSINGPRQNTGVTQVQGSLTVTGWVAVDTTAGVAPDAIFVTLSDDRGEKIYVKTKPVMRGDVAAYLHKPGLVSSGYTAGIDVKNLHGKHNVGLSFLYKNKLNWCRNVAFPIEIK